MQVKFQPDSFVVKLELRNSLLVILFSNNLINSTFRLVYLVGFSLSISVRIKHKINKAYYTDLLSNAEDSMFATTEVHSGGAFCL